MRALPLLFGLLVNWAIGQPGDLVRLPVTNPIPAQAANGQEDSQFSFEMVNRIIFVEAVLNGEAGNFILDTGAPELVINATDFGSGSFLASGINGRMPARWVTIELFEWAGTQNWKIEAMTIDLSHLESITNREITGIIGYSVLKEYELFLDYKNNQIQLIKPEDSLYKQQQPLAVIPFELNGHLPVIEVIIGERKLKMGLDTGASTNLICRKKQKKINPSCLLPLGKEKLAGLSPQSQSSPAVHIRCTRIEGINYFNMKFIFANISHLNHRLNYGKIDGLLGYPFFSSGKFSFDYHNQRIYVWEMPHSDFLVKLVENRSN
jgi:hypothetical protein